MNHRASGFIPLRGAEGLCGQGHVEFGRDSGQLAACLAAGHGAALYTARQANTINCLKIVRIGIVTATYSPSRNGVATSTELFVRGLRALGHEVRVFAPQHPKAGIDEGVYRLPSTLFGAPKDYPLLLPLVTSPRLPLDDLDIIHTMHPFVAGRTALLWARRLDVPLVFTAHTQYHSYIHYAPAPKGFTRWAVQRLVRTFAQRADLVLAPGQAMVKVLRAYGYRGEVTVLANPVDRRRFSAADARWVRARYGVPKGAPLLIFVGRLAPEKNLERLLDAFRLIHEATPEAQLLIVGDGPSRSALEAGSAGLPVRFAGGVDNANLPPYLAAADLFVTASVSETGSPMTFLEALAAGTPVVAARGASADEVIAKGVNGVSCSPDAASLSQAVLRLLADPARLEALRRGALETVKRFDVEHQARALARHYRGLLERRLPLAASSGVVK
jgi:1,2-diacylglycerol 3-alpha-glucosyltransferase